MYDKNCIKLMWRYYCRYYTYCKIASMVKKQFNLCKTVGNIRNDISKMFGNRLRRKDYNDRQIRYLLFMYANTTSTEKLLNYINTKKPYGITITKNGISLLASSYNVSKIKRKINASSYTNKNEHDIIIKMYKEGYNTYELAEKFNYKTQKSISDILKKYNVKTRHGSDSYMTSSFSFEKINNESIAYYLGILLTDGYLNSNRNNVSVQMKDYDVIRFIADLTNSTLTKVKNDMYRTSIYHSKYREQLARLGVTDNKSLTLEGPSLHEEEKKFIPYILRGIIDGDGWIRKDGKEFFICSASRAFIDWCKESLEYIGMSNLKIRYEPNDYNGLYYVRSSLKSNIIVLQKKIYNKPFAMERKYNRVHVHKDVQRS